MTQKDPEGPRRTQKDPEGPRRTRKDQEGPRKTKKDPVRLSKLRQTSQLAFAASSFSSWLSLDLAKHLLLEHIHRRSYIANGGYSSDQFCQKNALFCQDPYSQGAADMRKMVN